MVAIAVTVLMLLVTAPAAFADSEPMPTDDQDNVQPPPILPLSSTVQCLQGQDACTGAHHLTITGATIYCCQSGFSMSWHSAEINGVLEKSCSCHQSYDEYDCLQDADACENSTSVTPGGDHCCVNGDSMIATLSLSEVTSCKCRKLNTLISVGGVIQQLSPEQQDQLNTAMTDLNEEMNQWTQTLGQQITSLVQNIHNQVQDLTEGLNNLFGKSRKRRSRLLSYLRK